MNHFSKYLNKEVLGTELTTIVNKAVDNNEKNSVPKDEQGFYVTNDINSVKIQIQILEGETALRCTVACLLNLQQNSLLF